MIWKHIFVLAALLALTARAAISAPKPADAPTAPSEALKDSVILIIRHAEKPETGQGLTPAGEERARAYIQYFQKLTVDAQPLKLDHIFATADSAKSQRPRLTVEPLGKALGMKIDTGFTNKKFQGLVDEIRAKDHGKRILICWHHGEIPDLARALGADPDKLLPEGKWPPEVFGWMLELCYDHDGRLDPAQTKRINENLMPGDSK